MNVADVEYTAWDLIGKTLAFTLDLSAADCGCNAAVYLVSMAQNNLPGNCGGDRYCDANAVCGVRCAEIDIIEANKHALHITGHTPEDGDGRGRGIGGSFGTAELTPSSYGPGSSIVDTTKPMRVLSYFKTGNDGMLSGIEVQLIGASGRGVEVQMLDAMYARRLHMAVKNGMTPTVSYWSDSHLGWLQDGVCPGWNEVGEGTNTQMDACGDHITVSDFEVFDGKVKLSPPPPNSPEPPPSPSPPPPPYPPPPCPPPLTSPLVSSPPPPPPPSP